MDYLYTRCSTNGERQNLLRQVKFGESHVVKPENMFKEYISGSKDKRPELDRLLEPQCIKKTILGQLSSLLLIINSVNNFLRSP